MKLPVFIYGKVHFFMLNGKIVFDKTKVKCGMVKIGLNADSFSMFDGSGFISLGSPNSRIIFEGPVTISLNSKLRVVEGELRLGKHTFIGSGVRIICNESNIYIREYTRIAFDTVIMDSGFHYVYDKKKERIARRTYPIEIGSYNWIGNRSTIFGGCYTKEFTIITARSLVNKNFTGEDGEYMMLAGIPAKLIATGLKRVFSSEYDVKITNWFNKHPNENYYLVGKNEDMKIF